MNLNENSICFSANPKSLLQIHISSPAPCKDSFSLPFNSWEGKDSDWSSLDGFQVAWTESCWLHKAARRLPLWIKAATTEGDCELGRCTMSTPDYLYLLHFQISRDCSHWFLLLFVLGGSVMWQVGTQTLNFHFQVYFLPLLLTRVMILCKSTSLYVKNEIDNNSNYFIGLLWKLNELKYIKHLEPCL